MPVRPHTVVRSTAVLALIVAVGCGGSTSQPDDDGEGGGAKSRTVSSARCNETLESVLDMLQPQRYEISSDADGVLPLLNSWSTECQSGQLLETAEEIDGERLRDLLPEDWRARATSPVFVERDAEHVRNSLLLRSVAFAASRDATDDLARAVDVFEFVVRHVQLLPDDDPLAAIGPFHALLFGEGSARDRAWVFAALLRQIYVDAVIVRPADESTSVPLVGVLIEGRCHLFDPAYGIALPGAEDDGTAPVIRVPATLGEVRGEGDLLTALDTAASYRFRDAEFDEVRIELVGNSSGWAPRLAGLQSLLTGDRPTVVLDPLDDTRLGFGLVSRVTTAGEGRWTEDDIGVWSYPEACFEQGLEDDDRRLEILARRDVFGAPMGRNGIPEHLLLRARLALLTGRADDAVNDFVGVRNGVLGQTSDVAVGLHQRAEEDAEVWGALAAGDRGETSSAAGGMTNYLRTNPRGHWTTTVRLERAMAMARGGDLERAAEEVESVSEDDPAHAGLQYLARRWRAAASVEPDDEADDESTDAP